MEATPAPLSIFFQRIHHIVAAFAEQDLAIFVPAIHSHQESLVRAFWPGSLVQAPDGDWGFVPLQAGVRKLPSGGLGVVIKWQSGVGLTVKTADLVNTVSKVIPGMLSCSLDPLVRGFKQGPHAAQLVTVGGGEQQQVLIAHDLMPSGKCRLCKSVNGGQPRLPAGRTNHRLLPKRHHRRVVAVGAG